MPLAVEKPRGLGNDPPAVEVLRYMQRLARVADIVAPDAEIANHQPLPPDAVGLEPGAVRRIERVLGSNEGGAPVGEVFD
jgi:hypothetical protein